MIEESGGDSQCHLSDVEVKNDVIAPNCLIMICGLLDTNYLDLD